MPMLLVVYIEKVCWFRFLQMVLIEIKRVQNVLQIPSDLENGAKPWNVKLMEK